MGAGAITGLRTVKPRAGQEFFKCEYSTAIRQVKGYSI